MTGPSASGSEKGTPSSIRSAPASTYASATASAVSRFGNPPIMYGISAVPSSRAAAKASAIRAGPVAAGAVRSIAIERPRALQDLGEVLVPAPAETQDVVTVGVVIVVEQPRDRVRGLQRREDPLETGQLAERAQRR